MRQGSIVKEIVRGTSIYSIAILASRATAFVLLPVYTRYLTPEDYGVLELLELTSFVFSGVIGLKIGESLFYHYSATDSPEQKRRTICTIYLGGALLGALGAAIGWFAAPWLSRLVLGSHDYIRHYHLVFVAFAGSLPVEVGLCYLRSLNRPAAYTSYTLARLGVAVTLNLILLIPFRMGVFAMLWSSLVTSLLMAALMARLTLANARIRTDFSFPLLGRFIRYSAPLGVSGLGMLVLNSADRFFLRRFASLSEVGLYALAYRCGVLITHLQMPFGIYWRAQMYSIVRRPEGEKIYTRVATYLMLGLSFLVLSFAFFGDPTLRILVPASYWPAGKLIPWIALAFSLRTLGGHFRCAFLLEARTVSELGVTSLGATVGLATYITLIPRFGIWGAVAGTMAAFGTMLAAGLWQAQRVRYFRFEFRRFGKLTLTALALAIAFSLVRTANPWVDILLGCAFVMAYPALLLLLRFFDGDEIRFFLRAVAKYLPPGLRARLHIPGQGQR